MIFLFGTSGSSSCEWHYFYGDCICDLLGMETKGSPIVFENLTFWAFSMWIWLWVGSHSCIFSFTKFVSISIYLFDCLGVDKVIVTMIICDSVSGMKVVLERVLLRSFGISIGENSVTHCWELWINKTSEKMLRRDDLRRYGWRFGEKIWKKLK